MSLLPHSTKVGPQSGWLGNKPKDPPRIFAAVVVGRDQSAVMLLKRESRGAQDHKWPVGGPPCIISDGGSAAEITKCVSSLSIYLSSVIP